MTRAELLARRAHLLPIYSNPNPEHEMQHVEVTAELDWIAEQLANLPREETQPAKKPARRPTRDGRALAAG